MAISVVMPALEMAQETGKLVAWKKKEGEAVSKGETLLEVETDKAVMEIEAPGDGVLAGVKVQEGAVVPVGQTIAWIVRPGEAPPREEAVSTPARKITELVQPAARTVVPSEAARSDLRISPKARRLGEEHGVDLSRLRGSGPHGEILADDVLAAAKAQPATGLLETPGTVGRLMAERTARSWTTVPHFFVTREVDATALVEERQRLAPAVAGQHDVKLTHTDLIVALVGRAIARHPRMNASWVGPGIRLNSEINLAIAIATDDGVVAPVIGDTAKISLGEIASRRERLAERARQGRLSPAELAGGTFTISNLGMFQVDAFSAIITPPQVAILAVGAIADRVVAVAGKPAVRPMITMTLSCDHRVIDGARAALFMKEVADAVREPEKWLGGSQGS
ncbi:MAG TPA: dihydrolipoamide acetyltransferase family protein [Candidatus Angelobacter sp.]|nr:dihydrolipoamide acetyltransferase family protein [Candidatus Angelobacter sp.]